MFCSSFLALVVVLTVIEKVLGETMNYLCILFSSVQVGRLLYLLLDVESGEWPVKPFLKDGYDNCK